jgi:peroxiredoxin
MPPAEFEPAIPASERPQTHTLDCAVTGTGFSSKLQEFETQNTVVFKIQ